MPVQTTAVRAILAGNGAAVSFPFGFHCTDSSTIQVVYTSPTGVSTTLPPSSYSVVLTSGADGGTVTYPIAGTPIPVGSQLTIVRQLPLEQLTNLSNQGAFYPSVVIGALDAEEMQIQQVADATTRAVTAPVTDPIGLSMQLPSAASRAGQLLGFGTGGGPALYTPGAAVITDAAGLSYESGAVGSVATTVAAKLGDSLDLKADFGAKGDGVTDDTAAFQAFVQAVLTTGRPGYMPAGDYILDGMTIDLSAAAKTGARIEGAGGQQTVLDFRNSASGLVIACLSGPSFYFAFRDFAVRANCAGAALAIGRYPAVGTTNYTDQANSWLLDGIIVNNYSTSTLAVGMAMNGVYDCNVRAVVNCAKYGDSLQLNECQFTTFEGSYSGANVGIHLETGYNFGNTFLACDVEVVNVCVSIDNASSNHNSWVGGTFVWSNGSGPSQEAINGTNAGPFNSFTGVNLGSPGTVVVPANSTNVTISGVTGGPVTATQVTVDTSAGSADADVVLNRVAGASGYVVAKTSGSTRWQVGVDNTAESGSNVGSDYIIERYSDAGTLVDTPLTVVRSTGQTNIASLQAVEFGAFGSQPSATAPVVTGSVGNAPALASLIAAMAQLGLIQNQTTA